MAWIWPISCLNFFTSSSAVYIFLKLFSKTPVTLDNAFTCYVGRYLSSIDNDNRKTRNVMFIAVYSKMNEQRIELKDWELQKRRMKLTFCGQPMSLDENVSKIYGRVRWPDYEKFECQAGFSVKFEKSGRASSRLKSLDSGQRGNSSRSTFDLRR